MNENSGGKTIDEMAKEKFLGATIDLSELKRQDGLLAEAIDKSYSQRLGVIQQTITAIHEDKLYRQIILNARWKSPEEQDKCINALAYCEITGAVQAKRIILDRLTARASGIKGENLHEALEALTHTTFTTRQMTDQWRKHDGDRKSSSPIA